MTPFSTAELVLKLKDRMESISKSSSLANLESQIIDNQSLLESQKRDIQTGVENQRLMKTWKDFKKESKKNRRNLIKVGWIPN